MKLNFNDLVTVTLNPAGVRMRDAHYHRIGLEPPTKTTITEPLWYLLQVFGPHIYMGMPEMPFAGNRMDLESASITQLAFLVRRMASAPSLETVRRLGGEAEAVLVGLGVDMAGNGHQVDGEGRMGDRTASGASEG